jgi:alcohol dehydrogenase YqhD (iron-dependent ADH family)
MTITVTGQTLTDVKHQLGLAMVNPDWITINSRMGLASDRVEALVIAVRGMDTTSHTDIEHAICRIRALMQIAMERP